MSRIKQPNTDGPIEFVITEFDCNRIGSLLKKAKFSFKVIKRLINPFNFHLTGHDSGQRSLLRRRLVAGAEAGLDRGRRHRHGREGGHGTHHGGSQGLCSLQGTFKTNND